MSQPRLTLTYAEAAKTLGVSRRGYLGGVKDENGETVFVIAGGCPLHAPSEERDAA
jgi:hypothetical protein